MTAATDTDSTTARLRQAAQVAREASAAALGSDEPWRYAKGSPDDSVRTSTGWEVATSDNPNNLRWIALMGPVAGEPIARLLEGADELHEQETDPRTPGCGCGDEDWPCADMRHALAVADAILAEPTP